MKKNIAFYFDYSSPFGYLAYERIWDIAKKHDRGITLHPIILGAIFKISRQTPLTLAPLKGEYSIHDFSRSAREHKVDYRHPDPFPIGSVLACRATLWLRDNPDPSLSSTTRDFVQAVYRSFFCENKDITDVSTLADLAESLGINGDELVSAVGEPAIKEALRVEVDAAVDNGVFGSPMMIVDGEPFWGHDRLEQMDRWITTGGW